MPPKNLPALRPLSWAETLPEFEEQAVNDYYRPNVIDFGLFTHN